MKYTHHDDLVQVRAQKREDDLSFRVTEAAVELQHFWP